MSDPRPITSRVDPPSGRVAGTERVGERLTTRARTITEADIVMFAALTGDWHPQHTDEVWAATSLFGGRIAHGLLVVSIALGLVPLDPSRVVAIRRADAVFKRPVRVGETVRAEATVLDRRPLDDALSLVRCSLRIVNEAGRMVTKVTLDLLWREEDESPKAASADRLADAGSEALA